MANNICNSLIYIYYCVSIFVKFAKETALLWQFVVQNSAQFCAFVYTTYEITTTNDNKNASNPQS